MQIVVVGHGVEGEDALGGGIPWLLPAAPHLDRVVAGEDDEVGGLDDGHQERIGRRREGGGRQRHGVVLGQEPLGLVGLDHRHREALGETANCRARTVLDRVEAGDHDRPPGLGEPAAGEVQCCALGRCGGLRAGAPGAGGRCGGGGRDLDRHVDQHRPRPRVRGQRQRLLGDEVGGGRGERERPLDRGLQQPRVIDDLVVVGQGVVGIDRAREHDERHPVEPGIGDDVDGVADARPHRRHQHRRRAGPLPDGFRHEAGRRLVLGRDEGDARRRQGVDQRQDLATGNAEGEAATGLGETAGHLVGGTVQGHGSRTSASFDGSGGSARTRGRRRQAVLFSRCSRKKSTIARLASGPLGSV